MNIQLAESQIKQLKQFQAENETCLAQAKESLLNLLPSILSHMTQVWQRCNVLLNSNGAVNILFDQQQSHTQQSQQHHQCSWILGRERFKNNPAWIYSARFQTLLSTTIVKYSQTALIRTYVYPDTCYSDKTFPLPNFL